MSQIRGKNTNIEKIFRKHIRINGLKGFRNGQKTEGRPDFIFPKQKIAIFLDGCFWHGCPRCYSEPKTNKKFWRDKFISNKKRDTKVNLLLRKKGWKIKRFWEHRVKKDPERCILSLKKILERINGRSKEKTNGN